MRGPVQVVDAPAIGRTNWTLPLSRLSGTEWLVLAAFFLSAVSAPTYQVTWQRLLNAEFGVDLKSITIIVSCFMLGRGLGSFLGRLAPVGILAFNSTGIIRCRHHRAIGVLSRV